jgi:hypothetical protein
MLLLDGNVLEASAAAAGGLELLSDDWLECKGKRNGLLLELLCVDAAIVITLEVIVVCNSHPFFHVSPRSPTMVHLIRTQYLVDVYMYGES